MNPYDRTFYGIKRSSITRNISIENTAAPPPLFFFPPPPPQNGGKKNFLQALT